MDTVQLYTTDFKIALNFEDTEENTDPVEKEKSEKEDSKEKDKIFQFYDEELLALSKSYSKVYPEFYFRNTSIVLEYTTPPPKFI